MSDMYVHPSAVVSGCGVRGSHNLFKGLSPSVTNGCAHLEDGCTTKGLNFVHKIVLGYTCGVRYMADKRDNVAVLVKHLFIVVCSQWTVLIGFVFVGAISMAGGVSFILLNDDAIFSSRARNEYRLIRLGCNQRTRIILGHSPLPRRYF